MTDTVCLFFIKIMYIKYDNHISQRLHKSYHLMSNKALAKLILIFFCMAIFYSLWCLIWVMIMSTEKSANYNTIVGLQYLLSTVVALLTTSNKFDLLKSGYYDKSWVCAIVRPV